MNKPNYPGIARTHIAIVLSAWLLALSISLFSPFVSGAAPGDSDLQSGQKFEIVGELYAFGVTDDPRSRKLSIISVVPLRLRGPEIISSQLVPIGSIVTIVNKEPKRARAYFIFSYPVQYIIQVDSINAPAGIPVVIGLFRGIEGKSTALNPLIFKPLLGQ